MDGAAGTVSEGRVQSPPEVATGTAADRVDPGQSQVHGVWCTGEHVVGPTSHLKRGKLQVGRLTLKNMNYEVC